MECKRVDLKMPVRRKVVRSVIDDHPEEGESTQEVDFGAAMKGRRGRHGKEGREELYLLPPLLLPLLQCHPSALLRIT